MDLTLTLASHYNPKAKACLESARVRDGEFATLSDHGMNGMFRLVIDGKRALIIASDQGGWKHVSITHPGESKPPTHAVLAKVKDLFWLEDEVAIHYYPAKADHVNNHIGCMHLWSPLGCDIPTPPSWMVGVKGIVNATREQSAKEMARWNGLEIYAMPELTDAAAELIDLLRTDDGVMTEDEEALLAPEILAAFRRLVVATIAARPSLTTRLAPATL